MKKLIVLLFAVLFCLTACSSKEIPTYNLAICDENLVGINEYLTGLDDDSLKVETTAFSQESLNAVAQQIKESKDNIRCITLYSKNVTDEVASLFIEVSSSMDIPVVFAFSSVTSDILHSYDKAFCITTNYTHAAEMTAVKLKELWTDGQIADRDENMIMSFAGITDDSNETKEFYIALVKNIELYGIPMMHNGTVLPNSINEQESWDAFFAENEFVIVCHSFMHYKLNEYQTDSGKKEFLIFDTGNDKTVRNLDFAVSCYTDFEDYKQAASEIVANFEQRQFPLDNISYPYIDRTIYIPAEIQD